MMSRMRRDANVADCFTGVECPPDATGAETMAIAKCVNNCTVAMASSANPEDVAKCGAGQVAFTAKCMEERKANAVLDQVPTPGGVTCGSGDAEEKGVEMCEHCGAHQVDPEHPEWAPGFGCDSSDCKWKNEKCETIDPCIALKEGTATAKAALSDFAAAVDAASSAATVTASLTVAAATAAAAMFL